MFLTERMSYPISRCRLLLIAALLISTVKTFAQADSCWTLHFDGNDPQWPGYYVPDISKVVKVSDGFIVGGATKEHIFPSRDGDTIGRTSFGGIFIAKYDFDGNLQWLDYGIDPIYGFNGSYSRFFDIAADPQGNIYFSGVFSAADTFYYNDGQATSMIASGTSTQAGVIVKLDGDGQVLWQSQIGGPPMHLEYAANGSVVASGVYGPYPTYFTTEGDWMTATFIGEPGWFTPDVYQYLLWIDTANGELQQFTDFRQTNANAVNASDMTTDAEGNVILTGRFEYEMCFYTPGRTDSMMLGGATIAYEHPRMFTAKYNTAGVPLWRVSDRKTWPGSGPQGGSYSFDVTTTPDGTIYLNSYDYLQHVNTTGWFYNPDSTMVSYQRRESSLISLTKDGYFRWIATCGFESIMGFVTDESSILVAGISSGSWTSNVGITDTSFSAGGGSFIHLPMATPEMVLVRFDTAGQLINALKMGSAEPSVNLWNGGMCAGDNESVLIFGGGQTQWAPMILYGDTMQFNETDGFIVKTTPGVCNPLMLPTFPPPPQKVMSIPETAPFSVFPNPVHRDFTISGNWDSVSSIEIRNIVGVIVYQQSVDHKGEGSRSIHLSDQLASGCYILRLKGAGKDVTSKLILE